MTKIRKRQRSESDSDESSGSEWEDEPSGGLTNVVDPEELDSDEELQRAFSSGELKPGLNFAADARRPPVNNKERLLQKLEEIRLDLPWIERLDVTTQLAPLAPEIAAEIGIDPNIVIRNKKTTKKIKPNEDNDEDPEELDNVDDDFKRELRFYRQAQGAVLEAIPRLHALGVPTKRPDDYFAQMAKSDEQMKKVREKLVAKQRQMELSEKAKKLREQRKYGKQVQQEVLKKRQEDKKRLAESVKKFRKGGKTQQDELDFMTELEGGSGGNNARMQKGRGAVQQKGPLRKSGKQQYKESRYGFGGQKKRSKYNTKESADDVYGRFDKKKHGSGPARGKGKGKSQKRPGKVSRQKMKSKSKR